MMDARLTIAPEEPADYRAAEEMTREAFWNHHVPGCDEHYLLHALRTVPAFIRELDLVAKIDGRLVGQIVFTEAMVLGDDAREHRFATFGPLAVHPRFQKRGIGGKLVRAGLDKAKRIGFRAVLITGDPEYYRRFGFVPAERYKIGTRDNRYAEALLALELKKGALAKVGGGRFFEDSCYQVDEALARAFDESFEPKRKTVGTGMQKRFEYMVSRTRPRD